MPAELPKPRNCGNCGSSLLGPFCHQCGQPERSPVRELVALVKDGLGEILSLDGKFFRSMWPLLFKPGALTREYLDGRRISFIRPFRLYVGISIILFLAIALFDDPLHFGSRKSAKSETAVAASETPVKGEIAASDSAGKPAVTIAPKPPKKESDGLQINFGGKSWDPRKDPLDIPFVPQVIDDFLRTQLIIVVENGKQIEQDPTKLWRSLVEHLPQSLFFLLPLFALLLKVMYIFKRRLYIEHLIVALHSHSFLFLCFLLMLTSSAVAGLWPATTHAANALRIILLIWMPIYLLLMQKRVYRQGWFMTVVKYLLIGLIYVILISLTAIVAFVLAVRFMD